jgi:hypothetical protein
MPDDERIRQLLLSSAQLRAALILAGKGDPQAELRQEGQQGACAAEKDAKRSAGGGGSVQEKVNLPSSWIQ